MTAFFFGHSGRQLYGYHHAPRGTARGAVLICPSWGPDYQYAHRALRVLAKRLAETGFHAMRFDYSGTGDSWGHSTEADTQRWVEDVHLAIQEFRIMSGQAQVDIVGLRLGAFVAVNATVGRADVRRLVLWDPVVDGPAWLHEIDRRRASLALAEGETPVEFANRLVTPALLRQFHAIAGHSYPDPGVNSALALKTTTANGEGLERMGISNLQVRTVEDASPWIEDTSIWAGAVPARVVAAVVDWLGDA
jgi:alpha-beta hydrolase superfamily lysophospholipase